MEANTPSIPNYLSVSKKINVPNQVAGFPIDQIKRFFENLTVLMEKDTTN
jgi:hypothetical protein